MSATTLLQPELLVPFIRFQFLSTYLMPLNPRSVISRMLKENSSCHFFSLAEHASTSSIPGRWLAVSLMQARESLVLPEILYPRTKH